MFGLLDTLIHCDDFIFHKLRMIPTHLLTIAVAGSTISA